MAKQRPLVARKPLHEIAFDFCRIRMFCQTETDGDAGHMGIDDDAFLDAESIYTTFAVLRPTPGKVASASRDWGTCPLCSATSFAAIARMLFALFR
jgi:hypothetical protein